LSLRWVHLDVIVVPLLRGSQEHAMPRRMEHSRRHGPFDPRFRLHRSKPIAALDELPGGPQVSAWEDEGGALREAPPARLAR
jgi:hypothetical protein